MKVLVTAASKHGSTAEIASVIAGVLRTAEIDAVLVDPEHVRSLAGYDAVIVGSAVYAGHWLEPAKAFVRRYRIELADVPVFLFSSGPVGDPPTPAHDPADLAELDEATGAIDHQVFAGRVSRRQLNVFERLGTIGIHADGDFRPWDDIADSAGEIARFLTSEPVLRSLTEPLAVG